MPERFIGERNSGCDQKQQDQSQQEKPTCDDDNGLGNAEMDKLSLSHSMTSR
jgi:hypothetical protein